MANDISITYAYEGFFDGCIDLDTVDQDATINAWEALVNEKLEAAYPDAHIDIEQRRSCMGSIYVDGFTDSDEVDHIRSIMDAAFADENIWIVA